MGVFLFLCLSFWSLDNLTQALMFLSHFMGDVHQPLHVGFTTDAGGNSITVYWYNVKTNLHSVKSFAFPYINCNKK